MHGWQDYNVKQSEGVDLYRALPLTTRAAAGTAFKRLYLFQGGHQSPSGPRFDAAARRVLRHHAEGRRARPELAAPVLTQGRTAAAPGEFRVESAWPPAGGASSCSRSAAA